MFEDKDDRVKKLKQKYYIKLNERVRLQVLNILEMENFFKSFPFIFSSFGSISKYLLVVSFFFISGIPQRLDAGDWGRPTRYCYLESIYHTWDGGTDHRASLVSHPTQCVVKD